MAAGIRLYIDGDLAEGVPVAASADQAHYLGRVMRQDLSGARTDFVSDKEEDEKSKSVEVGGKIEDGGWDPYRVIDTNKFCTLHTDNAYSNPRPPDYVGLMCLSNAALGGESLLMSAYTLHNQILEQHPEYLERIYQDFSWDTPPLQTLPDGPPTKAMRSWPSPARWAPASRPPCTSSTPRARADASAPLLRLSP